MKKYRMFTVLLLTILFTLTACQGAKDDETQNSEIVTENTEKETETMSEEETEVVEIPQVDFVVMTEEELEWFEDSFFNTEENPIINMFLTSTYHYPEDINLAKLFNNGIQVVGASEVSDEEKQLLIERYDIMELDIFKVTTDEMDAILQKYMGITLEETNKVHLNSLYYLEEYDAYYSVVGDTDYMQYDFDYGWKKENGTVTMEYSFGEELYSVTLKEVDGTYYFVSNGIVK